MKWVFSLLFSLFLFIISTTSASAAVCTDFSLNPNPVAPGQQFTLRYSQGLRPGEVLIAEIRETGTQQARDCNENSSQCGPNYTNVLTFDTTGLTLGDNYSIDFTHIPASGITNQISCILSLSYVEDTQDFCSPQGVTDITPQSGDESSTFTVRGCAGPGSDPDNPCNGNSRVIIINQQNSLPVSGQEYTVNNAGGGSSCNPDGTFSLLVNNLSFGAYSAQLTILQNPRGQAVPFEVESGGTRPPGGICTTEDVCITENGNRGTQVCSGVYDNQDDGSVSCTVDPRSCTSCSYCGDGICSPNELNNACLTDCQVIFPIPPEYMCNNNRSIKTAIGCIPYNNINDFVIFALRWTLGVIGGMAILLIIIASFTLIFSSGDPQRINASKQQFMAVIAGVLMVIFSVFLLRIIGINILDIL